METLESYSPPALEKGKDDPKDKKASHNPHHFVV
jgi:hypothetical protein